ncbi:MAG TPA: histidine phosphatase family protein [Rhizomicrobium sp.]|nr:histidine phosphatase family protein [Rhizomicrobium sp.]
MKRLILLRHAKAAPDRAGLDDRDRDLAERGRADAIRMGQWLKEQECVPDHVLCSTAVRTRRTLELVLPQLGILPAVQPMDELYLARWMTIVNAVRSAPKAAGVLMVVGHNPGLEDCAHKLARPPGDAQGRKLHEAMRTKFPTGALAVLDFDLADWSRIEPGLGELEHFVAPKDLH